MKEINVLGINIKNFATRELLSDTEVFLKNGALNTVLYVNTSLILKAGEDENIKSYIEKADINILCEAELLRKCGITSWNSLRDIEDYTYLRELFTRISHRDYPVLLLADDEESLDILQADVLKLRSDLPIQAKKLLESDEDAVKELINEINDLVPKVLIIKASCDKVNTLLKEQPFINSEIAIILPDDMNFIGRAETFLERLRHKLYRSIFIRKVSKYENSM